MFKLSKHSHILYRFIQIHATIFALFYAYLGQYTNMFDNLLIFVLAGSLIRLTAHMNNLVEHNTLLKGFFRKIMPERPEQSEGEDCEDCKKKMYIKYRHNPR